MSQIVSMKFLLMAILLVALVAVYGYAGSVSSRIGSGSYGGGYGRDLHYGNSGRAGGWHGYGSGQSSGGLFQSYGSSRRWPDDDEDD